MGTWINISDIKVGKKQLKKLDPNKIKKHRIAFEEGLEVMPIDVVKINETDYNICGNGRHRYFGAIEAGMTMIEINVLNF